MHKLTFLPIKNADSCLLELNIDGATKLILFDYAQRHDPNDEWELKADVAAFVQTKLNQHGRDYLDVFCITHIDDDHIDKGHEFFELQHASKYQGDGRVKIRELWVPAGAITETGVTDQQRVWRAEARHRLKVGKDIRVFSRAKRLKSWLEENDLTVESRQNLLVDAGQCISGFELTRDRAEFFVHSPHSYRSDQAGIEDRNADCVVLQIVLRVNGVDTKIIMTGDATTTALEEMAKITLYHGREDRLAYDIFNIPHHCSYLSLQQPGNKGSYKTEPTDLVKSWLERGHERALFVASCKCIDWSDLERIQPPHAQAAAYYRDLSGTLGGRFMVTMEEPKKTKPEPIEINIDQFGYTVVVREEQPAATRVVSERPPRAG